MIQPCDYCSTGSWCGEYGKRGVMCAQCVEDFPEEVDRPVGPGEPLEVIASTPEVVAPVAVGIEPVELESSGPGMGRYQLSVAFPEVEVKTTSSFAHDYGDMTSVEEAKVGGELCETNDILTRLVALRGGWTRDGGSGDEEVQRVYGEFVAAWARLFEGDRLTSEEAPDDFTFLAGGIPSYHPPRVQVFEVEGERVVVSSHFQRGHISNRGRHWAYVVQARRVKDGAPFPVPPAERSDRLAPPKEEVSLPAGFPRGMQFSEAG